MKNTLILLGMLAIAPLAKAQIILEALDAPDPVSFILPSGVNIENGKYIIASTYDTNYLPFSTPTQPATWDRDIHPDATAEAKTLDYQGKIAQEGVIVNIPITVTSVGTNPKIPAYTQTINIPAWKTEDNISRNLTLSWEEQAYDANTKYIKATLKPNGLLNVKKLDLNAGLGNDYQGVELGTFSYDYQHTDNSTKGTSKFEVRALSGIPDRNFAIDGKHNFLYLPVLIEGPNNYKKVWLNYNLGAEYADTNNPNGNFNPTLLAVDKDDVRANGSLFQWQRPADGHELITWKNGIPDESKIEYLSNVSTSWQPGHNKVYMGYNDAYTKTWVSKDLDNASGVGLWKANGANNPCPEGFYVASKKDYIGLIGSSHFGYQTAVNFIYSFPYIFNITTSESYFWLSDDVDWTDANIAMYYRVGDGKTYGQYGATTYTAKVKTFPVRCVSND